jgi:signal transduction histidine kinase
MSSKRQAEFMINVSHELKTPLNAVIGFSSVLLQDKQLDSEKVHQLQLIYKSARVLLERIDALCDFYRLQAGAFQSGSEWLQVDQLLRQSAEHFREAGEQKGLPVEVGAQTLPARIRVSQKLIDFVLRELISNAVKYTNSGSVTLDGSVEPDAQDGRCIVSISVADTGSGLGPEALENISAALSSDSFAGLGLGLALSREAAAQLGGRIEVKNNPASGCTFVLVLNLPEGDLER